MSYVPYSNETTSHDAACSMLAAAGTDEGRVFRFIRQRGTRGATDEEVELALKMRANNSRARRRGLVLRGVVADSGVRRRTNSGRSAIVWTARVDPEFQLSLV